MIENYGAPVCFAVTTILIRSASNHFYASAYLVALSGHLLSGHPKLFNSRNKRSVQTIPPVSIESNALYNKHIGTPLLAGCSFTARNMMRVFNPLLQHDRFQTFFGRCGKFFSNTDTQREGVGGDAHNLQPLAGQLFAAGD